MFDVLRFLDQTEDFATIQLVALLHLRLKLPVRPPVQGIGPDTAEDVVPHAIFQHRQGSLDPVQYAPQ